MFHSKEHGIERTTVSFYTYIKTLLKPTDVIYIICHEEISESDKKILLTLHDVNFITPGPEVKNMFVKYPKHLDITGKVFHKSSADKTAVIAYVYYYEYWMEIYNHVKKLSLYEPIDLHVYLCNTCSTKHARHIMSCEQNDRLKIYFNWTENNGRDVRSFLTFIKNKHYLKYSKICKVHTKKTVYLDNEWRSNYLYRLLSPDYVNEHWEKLKYGHAIASLDRYLIHEKYMLTNTNYKNMSKVLKLMDLNLHEMSRFSFYAGTMFWCSYDMCKNIDSKITKDHLKEFEQEPIDNDGSLAHAWERIFSLL